MGQFNLAVHLLLICAHIAHHFIMIGAPALCWFSLSRVWHLTLSLGLNVGILLAVYLYRQVDNWILFFTFPSDQPPFFSGWFNPQPQPWPELLLASFCLDLLWYQSLTSLDLGCFLVDGDKVLSFPHFTSTHGLWLEISTSDFFPGVISPASS